MKTKRTPVCKQLLVPFSIAVLLAAVGSSVFAQKTQADAEVTPFAENVLTHVVLHELGHALVREFNLPILGNEETLADAFATHYAVAHMDDRAFDILQARIASLLIEADEVPRNEWTVKGEHNSDARRAYQIAATALAYDPQKYRELAELVEMDESEMRGVIDYSGEIHRSWRRILKPLRMAEGIESNEARLVIEEDSDFAKSLGEKALAKELESALRSFDWHSQVTIRFASGDGGAGWSRSRRTVQVRDGYVRRFVRQGKSNTKFKR